MRKLTILNKNVAYNRKGNYMQRRSYHAAASVNEDTELEMKLQRSRYSNRAVSDSNRAFTLRLRCTNRAVFIGASLSKPHQMLQRFQINAFQHRRTDRPSLQCKHYGKWNLSVYYVPYNACTNISMMHFTLATQRCMRRFTTNGDTNS